MNRQLWNDCYRLGMAAFSTTQRRIPHLAMSASDPSSPRNVGNPSFHRRSLTSVAFGQWLFVLAAVLVCTSAQAALRVTPSGGQIPHDGAEWMTAYSAADLQSAIDTNPGGEFWLARGGYGAIQSLPDGTQLYGGFLGVLESARNQRDASLNTTILDTVEITPYFDPNGNEIIQGPNTVVDGFLIVGFGVHIEKGTPVISNNVIRGANGIEAMNGAGPSISDCDIEGAGIGVRINGPRRQARQPNGQPGEVQPSITRSSIKGGVGVGSFPAAGIYQNFDAPKIKVSSTHISDMKSGQPLFLQGEAEFKDSFIENNSGFAPGATVQIEGTRMGLKVTFDNCAIRNNKGTGVVAQPMGGSSVVFSNSEISGNTSPGFGGGIWMNGDGIQIINSKIIGNQSARNGGGIYHTNFVPVSRNQIVNTLIAGNKAVGNGGGLAVSMEGLAVLNSTIVNNSASTGGGAWLESTAAFPNLLQPVTFTNSAITGNSAAIGSAVVSTIFFGTPNAIFRNSVALSSDTFADSHNLSPQLPPSGNGNFLVADAGYVDAASGDYRLRIGSPLVDRGDNAAIDAFIQQSGVAADLATKPRVVGPAVDVGAYELQAVGPVDVTPQISVVRGGFQFNRTTHRYVQPVTLKNVGVTNIAGPVSLVLDGLNSAVNLFGQAGVTSVEAPFGSPYRDVSAADLPPSSGVSLLLEFKDLTNLPITYTPRVLAGPGTR